MRDRLPILVVSLSLIGAAVPGARAQFVQQGIKLVGGAPAPSSEICDLGPAQGSAVALSSNGNTAVIGGDGDAGGNGAIWVFTRSGGAWSQQGNKLVGLGADNQSGFEAGVCLGSSLAVSSDGNTIISGGSSDGGGAGAAWVFTRANGTWGQQGPKLSVSDASQSSISLGFSVAISADGNTAIVSGIGDSHTGAIWPFTRSSGVWNQQGNKLIAGSFSGQLLAQGSSVAISGDGNTAMEGDSVGYYIPSNAGGAAVFTRNSGSWSEQGGFITVMNSTGLGSAVALSSDGNTALIGAFGDGGTAPGIGNAGASFVYVRSNGVWTQQARLFGSGAIGLAQQGTSVALSADGNTAIVGGPYDNKGAGAAWIFKRVGGAWSQLGDKLIGSGAAGAAHQGTSVALSGDGNTALLGGSYDSNNTGAVWVFVQGGGSTGAATPGGVSPSSGSAQSQSMQFTFNDPRGAQDLDVVNVLINNFLDGRNACYLAYSRGAGVLYLVANDGATLQGLPLNGTGSVSNSQCTVNGAGSSALASGNTLTLTLSLNFSAAFAGNRITYLAARDLEGGNSGWQALGVWQVPGFSTFPSVTSVNPPRGASSSQAFTAAFTDTKGFADLGVVNILINSSLDGRNACYIAYSQPFKVLYLVGDAGGGTSAGLPLGSSGSVSNSQCTVTSAGSSAVTTGNTLTITLNMSFTAPFDGNRIIYAAARDSAEANNSGWQAMATWTVQ